MQPKASIPMAEQETVICIDYNGKKADVYSSHPPTIRKLYKLLEHPDAKLDYDDKYGIEIIVPLSWIKVKPPRTYTEEQRRKMAERLAAVRK